MKNPMTPGVRRAVFMGAVVFTVFGIAMGFAWQSITFAWVVYGAVLGFWPSNPALTAAEEQKALEESC